MSTHPFITPASKNPPGNAIGDRTLSNLVTKFLQDIYPSVASLDSTPTSVTVYHLKVTQPGNDPKLLVALRNLKLSEVVLLLKEFSFEVTRFQNGTGTIIGNYTLTGQPQTPGTAGTFNGGTFDSNFGTLSLVDLAIDLLKQISFTIGDLSTGTSTAYSIVGTLEDWVEVNPHLKIPLGEFSPKYIFLLKKFFNFSAQKAGQTATLASRIVASDGNKNLGE